MRLLYHGEDSQLNATADLVDKDAIPLTRSYLILGGGRGRGNLRLSRTERRQEQA
jgi:hypothetical protein